MAKELNDFEIKGMWRIHTNPDIYCGDVEFQFLEEIGGVEYGNILNVRVRIKHSCTETVESLEQKILEAASDLLDLGAHTSAGENAGSLHERVQKKRDAMLNPPENP